MATAVLTNIPTTISLAESTTGWNGDSFSLEPDIKVQGSNSIACAQTNSGINDLWYAGSWDLTAGEHLRLWMNSSYVGAYGQTESLDGIQVYISDGTNTAYWTVGGSDTYGGGWTQLVVYTGNTPTSGTVPAGNTTEVGIRINTHSKPRNVPANMWVDAWYYGDGYTITGGTSGDEIDWSHVAALDYIEAYGVVVRSEDIYFMAGDISVGSGATTTYFKSSQKVQFTDKPVNSILYSITFQGSGCNVDITGGAWGAAGIQDYVLDASDATINSFTLSGVQFEKSGLITFSSVTDIQNSVFNICGQVNPSTGVFGGNSFSNYIGTTGAVLFPTSDSNFSDCDFINCDNGIEYDATSDATSPSLVDMTFDDIGGNYDMNNTSGAALTIALGGTSNANSYNPGGSTVTFLSSSTLTLTVKDETGSPVDVAHAYIDDNNITPFIMNQDTNASGIASTSWTGGSVIGATWRVRKYGYKPYTAVSDVPASGTKEIPVTLIVDPQQT